MEETIQKSSTTSLSSPTTRSSDNNVSASNDIDNTEKGTLPVKKQYVVKIIKSEEETEREEKKKKRGRPIREESQSENTQEKRTQVNENGPEKKKQKGANHKRIKQNHLGAEKKSTSRNIPEIKGEKNRFGIDFIKSLSKKKYDFSRAEDVIRHINKYMSKPSATKNSSTNKTHSSRAASIAFLNQIIANGNKNDNNDDTNNQSKNTSNNNNSNGDNETESIQISNISSSNILSSNTKMTTTNNDNTTTANVMNTWKSGESNYIPMKLNRREIKKVDFNEKLILAPLTTLGNLPFRRICVNFGVDITVGEMAVASNIIKGHKSELSLLRRHECEKVFGIQIAGPNHEVMCKAAQLLNEKVDVDFVDINCGCPIDAICNKGMGSCLMGRKSKLEAIVRGMTEILEVPLTVKMRTGLQDGKDLAHQLFPLVQEWGAQGLILHGRSKQQRYTKEARWDYVNECASLVDIPVIGNGDILTHFDYNERREICPNVSSVLIGRGALIKPWIFKEIKEQKIWDISSHERFEILKEFCNYGLEHYGSDEYGVQTTRRFMLEWLSFLHRYVPIGLIDRVQPRQRINERPPMFVGRDDMETLMASPNVADWIKISEMILGKVPDGFTFVPKHKSNAYSTPNIQNQDPSVEG